MRSNQDCRSNSATTSPFLTRDPAGIRLTITSMKSPLGPIIAPPPPIMPIPPLPPPRPLAPGRAPAVDPISPPALPAFAAAFAPPPRPLPPLPELREDRSLKRLLEPRAAPRLVAPPPLLAAAFVDVEEL